MIRSHVLFARKASEETSDNKIFSSDLESLSQAIDESKVETVKNLRLAYKVYAISIDALAKDKKNTIDKSLEKIQQLRLQNSKVQNKIIKYVRKMPKRNLAASRLYILMFDYMQDLYQSIQLISESCIDHLSNFHSQPSKDYLKASNDIEKSLNTYINLVADEITASSFRNNDVILEHYNALYAIMNKSIDNVIVEIQKEEVR